MTTVVVLDYGSGNLRSAERAVAATGAAVTVTSDLEVAAAADGLVVPGVGAFAACMAGIEAIDAGPMIAERVAHHRPVLGICVGMQIMFDSGEEHGVVTKGLGLLPGVVSRLPAVRVPHMGWNGLDAPVDSVLFEGLPADARAYFVHSYAVMPNGDLDAIAVVTTSTHERATFVAAAERGPFGVTQFHPEKSGAVGARVLRNWVASIAAG